MHYDDVSAAEAAETLASLTPTNNSGTCSQKRKKPGSLAGGSSAENIRPRLHCGAFVNGCDPEKRKLTEPQKICQKRRETDKTNWSRHIEQHAMPHHPDDKSVEWIERITVGKGSSWAAASNHLLKHGVCIINEDMVAPAFHSISEIAGDVLGLEVLASAQQVPALEGFVYAGNGHTKPAYRDYSGKR
jgi:hypothetical protein